MVKYIDSLRRKKSNRHLCTKCCHSGDPLKPTILTCLESKLESLNIIHFHVNTVEKPLFVFYVVSGMTVFLHLQVKLSVFGNTI